MRQRSVPFGIPSPESGSLMSTMTSSQKIVAIVQSNYLPWRGYFDLIRRSDEFILLDNTRRDWRNRNIIKTPAGPQWIKVPVEVKGKFHAAIDEIRIADPRLRYQACACY
jgi:WbqC-like protein family